MNPIKLVRQSAKRQRKPDTLTVEEMVAILDYITEPVVAVMIKVAATSALRRSEFRGLKCGDLDFDRQWFDLQHGVVGKHETKMKTEASRQSIPMFPELAEVLQQWRQQTAYPMDEHWVFASPFTKGDYTGLSGNFRMPTTRKLHVKLDQRAIGSEEAHQRVVPRKAKRMS